MNQYWLVHSASSGPAHFQHGTKAEAVHEATRLAILNQGTRFYVLESIGSAFVEPVFKTHDQEMEPPF